MSAAARAELWEALRERPGVTVLIVGGGINGAGLLRELALNGVDALLIDRSDFCSGASAASSRLIHGGLRYLEYGEFRLVAEAVRERNRLLQAAPHSVHPLATTIPIFDWTRGTLEVGRKFLGFRGRPSRRGALLVKAGLTLYESFAGRDRVLPKHRMISRKQALERHPALNPAIVCAATFHDAWISQPERLALEVILDAEQLGARALNYVSLISATADAVRLKNELTGETLAVRPTFLVNATGGWIDFTNSQLRAPTRFISGTKGSHLVIAHPELAATLQGGMIFFENDDGRICLVLPFHDKVLAGTTDIPINDPDAAICDDDEAAYILESIRRVFPRIEVAPSQVVFRFCGVRPLARSDDARLPGEISRDHCCQILEPGSDRDYPIFSLVGGKWTTFRAFAESVADRILERLARPRQRSSAELPIGGGREFPRDARERAEWLAALERETGLPAARLSELLNRYGTRASELARFIAADRDFPLVHQPDFSAREMTFFFAREHAARLADLVFRRTSLALLGRLNAAGLREIAGICQRALGWSDARMAEETRLVEETLRTRHGVNL